MNKLKFFNKRLAAVALLPFGGCSSPQTEEKLPNIIYIYADDLGYGDIGCYGQQYIKTPNIDRIATDGIMFTQHYSGAPVSAPARCCLLTGKHTGNAFVRDNIEIKSENPAETGQAPIPAETFTMAEMLKQSGYATALIGKWGLGSIASQGAPNKQGFDFFYGYADQVHAHNHYPEFLWRNDKQEFIDGNTISSVHPKMDKDEQIDDLEYEKYQGKHYSLDLMANEAYKFIRQNKNNPFFLYLAFVVPHKALQVPDESLEMYNDVFDETPYDGKAGYTPHPRPLSAYAAMVTRLDDKVGMILKLLQEINIDDNTLIMFSSDNGPAAGGGLNSRFFNSSGGLRGMKGQLYEGGIREPFVVRWPGKIKAGTKSNHISAQYDLMATLAEITNQSLTDTDGISFLPELLGNPGKQKKHEYLYWEFGSGGGQYAIRYGDWKGVRRNIKQNPNAKWEIYNLLTDKAEMVNVADSNPELAQKFDEIVSLRMPAVFPEWNF